ncbi:hypothetical protein K431DRAFT_283944 [Polychaeton citri CBS 116435]|uniref:Uncharacterized protein n=1 Tax=Polychaeton citri CBS 116435 TaxID=1314669 RepID=A0A9P4QAD3_9PEZI|nr:hypothetical protein K431DRAFT_283944 [Polychaeton citri CBS 116435]
MKSPINRIMRTLALPLLICSNSGFRDGLLDVLRLRLLTSSPEWPASISLHRRSRYSSKGSATGIMTTAEFAEPLQPSHGCLTNTYSDSAWCGCLHLQPGKSANPHVEAPREDASRRMPPSPSPVSTASLRLRLLQGQFRIPHKGSAWYVFPDGCNG